jgi:hypothetical protein
MTSTRIVVEVQSRVWFDDLETARSNAQAIETLLGASAGSVRLERDGKRLPLRVPVLDLQKAVYNHQTIDGEVRSIVKEIEKLTPADASDADEFWADFREVCLNPIADSITGRRVCAINYPLLAAKVSERLDVDAASAAETLKGVLGSIAAAAAVREFSTATAVRKTRG